MPLRKYVGNKLPWERTRKLILRNGTLIVPIGQSADLTDAEITKLSARYVLEVTSDQPIPAPQPSVPVNVVGAPTDGQGIVFDSVTGLWVPADLASVSASAFMDLTDVDTNSIADDEVLVWDAAAGKVKGEPYVPNLRLARSEMTATNTIAAGTGEGQANMIDFTNWQPLMFVMPDRVVKLRYQIPVITGNAGSEGRVYSASFRDVASPYNIRAQSAIYLPATAGQSVSIVREHELRPGEHFAVGATVNLKASHHINSGTDVQINVYYAAATPASTPPVPLSPTSTFMEAVLA